MNNVSEIYRLPNLINLGVGVVLFVSPWLLQFTDLSSATINARIFGLIIVFVASCELLALKEWEEWHDIGIGVWVMAAPVVLDFSPIPTALGAHLALGAILIASASWEIWHLKRQRANEATD